MLVQQNIAGLFAGIVARDCCKVDCNTLETIEFPNVERSGNLTVIKTPIASHVLALSHLVCAPMPYMVGKTKVRQQRLGWVDSASEPNRA